MKIILLCGANSNNIALANKIAQKFDLIGIVAEKKKSGKLLLKDIVVKVLDKLLFYKINHAWNNMIRFYKDKYSDFPECRKIIVSDINSYNTISFIKELMPDLVMVSGTSLIRDEILSLDIPKGMVNLHTGLSPYVKGGPNCTNWCLANAEFHLIGNTIMWINKGIDSGNIIASGIVELTGKESLNDIHIKVMEEAHNLYLNAVSAIQKHFEKCPSIAQESIDKGRLFLTRHWTFYKKIKLLYNLRKINAQVNSEEFKKLKTEIFTVNLPVE